MSRNRPIGISPLFSRGAIALLLATAAWGQSNTPAPTAPAQVPLRRYVIGPGDVLQVIVSKEPEASVAGVVVRPDGMISMPLIKEISVAGLRPRDLEQLVTQKLSTLIRDPEVTVIVKEIHSEKIYLIGALKKEGPITLEGPLTVLQAIAEAGGFTDYAKRNKIYVLRMDHGRQTRLMFDYGAVVRGEHPEQNITLLPGDSIVVPQ